MPTKTIPYRCIAASLAVLLACPAYANEQPAVSPIPPEPPSSMASPAPPVSPAPYQPAILSQPISQTLYKGVIGTLLEDVPIEPEKRFELQRGSTVISNTMSGRSLAVMLGVTNPVFIAVGLVWGLFAASKITPPRAQAPSNPFPGAVGVIVDRAIVSADGTILVSPAANLSLICIDSGPDTQAAAVRSSDEPLALIP